MTVEAKAVNQQFTQKSLLNLAQICFDAYKHRLQNISNLMFDVGKMEFNIIVKELISAILSFEPLKFSFSITDDPSLHFLVRFPSEISLFIETFLDLEDGHDTYIQIKKSNHTVLEINCSFDEGLSEVIEFLENEFNRVGYYGRRNQTQVC